jgi:hypothetical protein
MGSGVLSTLVSGAATHIDTLERALLMSVYPSPVYTGPGSGLWF